ncbi:hypothetical protein DL93DRAFT_1360781 [Clavulina sp. PMI_390]|nr:hypothetical protein DL93DRAFT_1360781 [Clavulina sp. PMI_390]
MMKMLHLNNFLPRTKTRLPRLLAAEKPCRPRLMLSMPIRARASPLSKPSSTVLCMIHLGMSCQLLTAPTYHQPHGHPLLNPSSQEIRTNLEDLRQREQPLPISEIAIMIGQRNKNQLKAVLEDYQNYPEVSQQSAGEINSFSGGVRRQKKARTKMFRQSMTDSQDLVTRALEQHKLAADSAVLVKNLLDVMKGGK